MTADITQLDPTFLPLVTEWLASVQKAGLDARIIVTYRDAADQNEVHAEHLSNAAAGQSPHNWTDANGKPAARAFDFALFDGDVYITNGGDDRYLQAGQIAETLGMTWGGNFDDFPDYDHIEMTDWSKA